MYVKRQKLDKSTPAIKTQITEHVRTAFEFKPKHRVCLYVCVSVCWFVYVGVCVCVWRVQKRKNARHSDNRGLQDHLHSETAADTQES